MNRFTPFPKVSSTYGAPMGRRSAHNMPWTAETKLCAKHQGGGQGYDSGGAYWGDGAGDGPVWAVWERGKGREGVVYVRAWSARNAIAAALEDTD